MSTLRVIQNMYCNYLSETGKRPTRIYVGKRTRQELLAKQLIFVHGSVLNEELHEEVMGLDVYVVIEDKHLFVC